MFNKFSKKPKLLKLTTLLITSLIGFGFSTTSNAAATFSPCSGTGYDISGNVSGSVDCIISNDFSQDFLNTDPLTVNTSPGFFNITNWIFGGKIGVNSGYNGTGTGQGPSTYNFSSVNTSNWENAMLVFKSGNDNSGVFLVGYLLDNDPALVTSGTWTTPFNDPPFNFPGNSTVKDVSHISVYYTKSECEPGVICDPQQVPEPETLPLLGLGLTTMLTGAWFRRKRLA